MCGSMAAEWTNSRVCQQAQGRTPVAHDEAAAVQIADVERRSRGELGSSGSATRHTSDHTSLPSIPLPSNGGSAKPRSISCWTARICAAVGSSKRRSGHFPRCREGTRQCTAGRIIAYASCRYGAEDHGPQGLLPSLDGPSSARQHRTRGRPPPKQRGYRSLREYISQMLPSRSRSDRVNIYLLTLTGFSAMSVKQQRVGVITL